MHSSAPASDSFSAIAHDRLRWFANAHDERVLSGEIDRVHRASGGTGV
jgi:hypothetical protein